MSAPPPTVFLSYAHADASVARKVADGLRSADVEHRSGEIAADWSPPPVLQLGDAMRTGDVLLPLLSPSSARMWADEKLSATALSELDQRAITVLPVLAADCDVPPALRGLRYYDLRSGDTTKVQHLVDQLSVRPVIDFGRLSYEQFEHLVVALLTELGWEVLRPGGGVEGADLVASRREDVSQWLVEVKLYQHSRFSVASVHQLVTALRRHRVANGLIVTSGQVTSAAKEFVRSSEQEAAVRIAIIDGATLTGLLLQQPHLVRSFFPGGSA